MTSQSIEILIPTYNRKDLLEKHLPHVLLAFQLLSCSDKVLSVIDDGSTDGTEPYLQTYFPEINLIKINKNQGFHHAINEGAKQSKKDLILLLNNDVSPDPLAFEHLFRSFQEQKNLFAVSGSVYSMDRQFLYGNRGGNFRRGHFHLIEKPLSDTSQSLFACGGAGLYDRRLFIELGCFDTLFSPFYYEEQDISYRALKRGYRVAYEPKATFRHEVSATINQTVSQKKKRLISARNNYLFIMKNITDASYFVSFLFFTPLYILKALFAGNPRFLIAFLMTVPRIPEAISKRYQEKNHSVKKDREIFRSVAAQF